MRNLRFLLLSGILVLGAIPPVRAGDLSKVAKVELQPLAAQMQRVADALDFIGSPLPASDKEELRKASVDTDHARAVDAIQTILDKHCLAGVRITPAKELEIEPGPARPELAEQGWRVFLVKVDNAAALGDVELRPASPNALPLYQRSSGRPDPKVASVGEVTNRFLDLMMFNSQPLVRHLSGLELEYRVLQIYCRDSGRKEAHLGFSLWRDTDKSKPIISGHQVAYIFDSLPAVLVHLRVLDDDGQGKDRTGQKRDHNRSAFDEDAAAGAVAQRRAHGGRRCETRGAGARDQQHRQRPARIASHHKHKHGSQE